MDPQTVDSTSSKATPKRRRKNPFIGVLWFSGIVVFFCLLFLVAPYLAMRDYSMRTRILNATLHRYLLAPDWILRIGSVERFGLSGVSLHGVRLVHRTAAGDETYAIAGAVEADFDPLPLLSNQLYASRIAIDSLRVRADLPPPEFRKTSKRTLPRTGEGTESEIKIPSIRVDLLSLTGVEIDAAKGMIARGSLLVTGLAQDRGKVRAEIVRIEAALRGPDSLRAAVAGGTVSGSLSDTLRFSGGRLLSPGLDSRIDAQIRFPRGPTEIPRATLLWNLDRVTPGALSVLRRLRIPFAPDDSLRGEARVTADRATASVDLTLRGRIFDAPLDSLRAIASRSGNRIMIDELSIAHRAGTLAANGEIELDHLNASARIRLSGLDLSDSSLSPWIHKPARVRIAATVDGRAVFDRENPEVEGSGVVDSIRYLGGTFGPVRFAGRYARGEVTIDSLVAGRTGEGEMRAVGRWSSASGDLEAEARFSRLPLDRWIGPMVHGIPFEGRVDGDLRLTGTAHSPQLTGRLEGRDFRVVEVRVARTIVDSIQGTLVPFDLHAGAHGGGINIYGARVDTASFHVDWDRTMRVAGFARTDSILATTHVTITPMEPGFLTVDDLRLMPGDLPSWRSIYPTRISWIKSAATIDSVRFLSPDGEATGALEVGRAGSFLDGRASLVNGNLESLRRLLGLPDSALTGAVDLHGRIGGSALRPAVEAAIHGRDLVVARWPVGGLDGRFAMEGNGTLRIDSLDAGMGGGRGRLHATGVVARLPVPVPQFSHGAKDSLALYLRRTQISGHVEVDSLSLSRVLKTSLGNTAGAETGLLAEPVDPLASRIETIHPGQETKAVTISQGIRGEVGAVVDLGGTGSEPRARASGRIRDLHIYEARADSLLFSASLEPGLVVLDSLVWHRGDRASRAHGALPLVVSLEPGKTYIEKDLPMSFDAGLPDIDLSILGALSRQIQEPAGTLGGSYSLRGTPAHPRPTGTFAIRDGALRIPNREERLHGIQGDFTVDTSGVHIGSLQAREGRSGRIEITGSFKDLSHFDLDAKVQDATIFETGLYHFTADGDFNAYPVVSALGSYPLVVGTVEVREGAIIGDLAKVPAAPAGSVTARSPWHAEIDVRAPGNLRLRTAIASVDLGQGDLHVSFIDPAFNVSGGLSVLGGRYRVFNNIFTVRDGGTVEFRDLGSGTPEPILDIYADTQVMEPGATKATTVTVQATGGLTKLDLAFTSDPVRTEDEIIAMLSVGRFTNQQTGQFSVSGIGNPGGQYLLTELVAQMETQISQLVGPLQNVSVQPGSAPGEAWKVNVRQSVLPQISVGYTRELAQQAGQEVNLRYNLRGVLYLNADVQRPHQTVGTPATTDVYSLDLKLHFEYQ